MAYFNFSDRPTEQRIASIASQFNLEINPNSINLYLEFQQVYREIEKRYDQLLEKFDLTESRFAILMFLFYSADKQLLPSEIAEKLGVARPTASKLLKGMKTQGLVTIEMSPSDKRASIVGITEKGIATLQRFLPYNYQAVDRLFEEFTEEERAQFYRLLHKLNSGKNKLQLLEESLDGDN
ncbi:MarR family transcriptional regulator [Enterococcus sp. JM4C]|uniref:MarR family winged helix-turn-helix transcriptional regulator n=1 Tax=Candidatus Enterococcus huntleyi TaxID=1857217 RepID=UPI0013793D3E|nr:MarR family transcriptional regulator [Enterococcus sp. JM4C]KAF1297093.1 MarR family transcriptional regulator [Enterococcus sp. JM4C]